MELKYYVVPSLVTAIKPYAFQKCNNLEAIYISDWKLTQIDVFPFEGCEHLQTIHFQII